MSTEKIQTPAAKITDSAGATEAFLEVKPVPPIKVETEAQRRFDAIAAEKAKREAAKVEAERLKAEGAAASHPPPEPVSPGYKPSEQVKRTQKILESIEQRKRERAFLISEKLRRGVEIERKNREAEDTLRDTVAKLRQEVEITALRDRFAALLVEGNRDLNGRQAEIEKLDVSLAQLRKQLQVELAKVDGVLGNGVKDS
jgi:hypothetical protein